jgi:hypothetical protein
MPKLDKEIIDVYEKVYFPKTSTKIKYGIFVFICKIEKVIANFFNYLKWCFKPSFKNISTSNIAIDLHDLDISNERVYTNDEIKRMYKSLLVQTEGSYDKDQFKIDLFSAYLRPKKKSSILDVVNS